MPGKVNNIAGQSDHETIFTAIFKEHEYKLYHLANRLTKSDQFAKDIIQEVFLKLWNYRDRMHEIEHVEAWLYRLTEHKVIDFLRKASAEARLKQAIWNNLQEIIHETPPDVETKEYNAIIHKAIEQLPPQRKMIYLLNRQNGLNYNQIASELQISRHTVKNQLSAALKFIRTFIRTGIVLILFLQ